MRTLAIINQKGGSGKTTTAINLAASLARRGRRTLLVDMDPQSHCAVGLAVPEESIELQIGDVLLSSGRHIDLTKLIWPVSRRMDLIPSTTKLAGLEASRGGLADREDREARLSAFLQPLAERYDYCLIDCPPSIGLLTFNALRASDEVLIPVETAYFALQGAAKQIAAIRSLCRRHNSATPFRLVATMHDEGSSLASDVHAELTRLYSNRLSAASIRLDPRLREAASLGVPVCEFDPECPGAVDYAALAQEIDAGNPLPPRTDEDDTEELVATSSAARAAFLRSRGVTAGPVGVGVVSEPVASATTTRPPQTRAAELADRARRLAARSAELSGRLATEHALIEENEPPRLNGMELEQPESPAPPGAAPMPAVTPVNVGRLFGVHETGDGVLFLHPAAPLAQVRIAGDHNQWSVNTTPMRFNPELGLHEARLRLPPGRYRYRLVVDGQWITDPYNPLNEPNPFGGRDSILIVHGATDHARATQTAGV